MKVVVSLIAFFMAVLLAACGSDTFQGRYVDQKGSTSYEFSSDGKLHIVGSASETTANYKFDADEQTIRLVGNQELPAEVIHVNKDGSLKMGSVKLTRGVSESMLEDSTWIGDKGEYTFALTFNKTDKGLETYSELVTYYDDDMEYVYQTDDSITRLLGDKLHLDQTIYTVSDVTDNSLKLSIKNQSMVIHKHPKGTAVEFRDGYTDIDAE